MKNRRKNNIIIGTLCCVLVLMGVGYAILSTTLNIGATAKITGDFDIHFLNDDQNKKGISLIDYDNSTSGNTVYNTTVTAKAVEMEADTEVDSQDPTVATFSAILQKPTDYAIFTVTVKNYGTIDGYLTFGFDDTNNNFSYYDDFYSVEFIKEGTPDIKADILQNETFEDSVVLSPNQTREYKIKVTYKESATEFPDTTTNGEFECTLNLTYSQNAPASNNNSGNNQSSLIWYAGNVNDDSVAFGFEYDAINDEYNIRYFIQSGVDITEAADADAMPLVRYDSTQVSNSYLGVTPTSDDYMFVASGVLMFLLHDNNLYVQFEPGENKPVTILTLDPTGSYEKYTSNNQQDNLTWYISEYENDTLEIALDEENIMKHIIGNDVDFITTYESSFGQVQFNTYDPNIVLGTGEPNTSGSLVGIEPQTGDYVWIIQIQEGNNSYNYVAGLLRGGTLYTVNFDDYSVLVTTRQD